MAVGRLCELRETAAATNTREGCGDLEDYLRQLETECEEDGSPGVFTWTPDDSTPDIVYYQVIIIVTCVNSHLIWQVTLYKVHPLIQS